ncbi:MAG: enoyl-CoA hydratase-related protein [Myxococcota bacterium]
MQTQLFVEDRAAVRVLTVSNPVKANALDARLLKMLEEAIAPGATGHVRAFVVKADGGQAFCAGWDLESLEPPGEGPLPDERLSQVMSTLAAHPAPSVALVNAGAFGAGCELAISCDFRVGGPRALFCMPPARLGVVYAPQGLSRLSALAGFSTAKRMFLTGRALSAEGALRAGLLDELHPTEEEATSAAFALADELAKNAPLAVAGMKRAFGMLTAARLTEKEQAELQRLRRAAFNSADAKEGRAAFLEKRAPRFLGS